MQSGLLGILRQGRGPRLGSSAKGRLRLIALRGFEGLPLTRVRLSSWGEGKSWALEVYSLTSSEIAYETLGVFLSREDAEAELAEILLDEPSRKDMQ